MTAAIFAKENIMTFPLHDETTALKEARDGLAATKKTILHRSCRLVATAGKVRRTIQ